MAKKEEKFILPSDADKNVEHVPTQEELEELAARKTNRRNNMFKAAGIIVVAVGLAFGLAYGVSYSQRYGTPEDIPVQGTEVGQLNVEYEGKDTETTNTTDVVEVMPELDPDSIVEEEPGVDSKDFVITPAEEEKIERERGLRRVSTNPAISFRDIRIDLTLDGTYYEYAPDLISAGTEVLVGYRQCKANTEYMWDVVLDETFETYRGIRLGDGWDAVEDIYGRDCIYNTENKDWANTDTLKMTESLTYVIDYKDANGSNGDDTKYMLTFVFDQNKKVLAIIYDMWNR